MAFRWVSPGCSWYEHHMLGGCQRPIVPPERCLPSLSTSHIRKRKPRLMVIIPFRGDSSSASLEGLCSQLPSHLDAQGVEFALLLVNQADSHPFNRGMLTNAAFAALHRQLVEGRKFRADWFTYIAVHDVDRYPDTRNRSCDRVTSAYYREPAQTPRVLHPTSYTGGVLLLRASVFQALNGFSNQFWGWGHEDNEFYLRLRQCGLPPSHAPEVVSCMKHLDCSECRKAKPANTLASLRAETRLIALVQERLRQPKLIVDDDGLSSVHFSLQNSSRRKQCGRHVLHILDVVLQRPTARLADEPCVADGGARDDGCVATVTPSTLPAGVVTCARNALPHKSQASRILRATRSRVMYNYRYEVDFVTSHNHSLSRSTAVYRVAICGQEWQPVTVPDTVRYQPIWRVLMPPRASNRAKRKPRLSKDFHYHGHFPCELSPPPWVTEPHSHQSAKLPSR
ncbi:hypothetical protein AB1Y20_021142 [Prymnesium parvum]|uniref:Uncharacterized protein n=1 Tax=Prymnesium parvum TaxID=97485 RepID=A0AB34JIS2_PRYPA